MICSKSKWKNMPKPLRIIIWTVLGIIGVVGMGILFGLGIMWLWNWLMPTIFGLGEITYWQAIGIFVLAKLIFGFGSHSEKDNSKPKKGKGGRCSESGSDWTEYESWWETEGKKSFEKYKEQKTETTESEQ